MHTPTAAHVTLRHLRSDALLDAIDYTLNARLSHAHPASSYGQPVVVRADGTLVDYAAIESLHLLDSTAAQAEEVARALEPFGIRVSFQPPHKETHL